MSVLSDMEAMKAKALTLQEVTMRVTKMRTEEQIRRNRKSSYHDLLPGSKASETRDEALNLQHPDKSWFAREYRSCHCSVWPTIKPSGGRGSCTLQAARKIYEVF